MRRKIDPAFTDSLYKHAVNMQTNGLRTTIMASKIMSKTDLDDFMAKYINAKSSLVNIESKINSVFAEYETDCELVGIVGLAPSVDKDVLETTRMA
jgi:hypothetical protein